MAEAGAAALATDAEVKEKNTPEKKMKKDKEVVGGEVEEEQENMRANKTETANRFGETHEGGEKLKEPGGDRLMQDIIMEQTLGKGGVATEDNVMEYRNENEDEAGAKMFSSRTSATGDYG